KTGFGSALQMVAGAIVKSVGTKVFFVRTGGFDTHASQQTRQGYFFDLMTSLDQGLTAFYTDLAKQGAINDTLIMSFSEFGRRIAENSSAGSDHGAGNNMFVLRGSVKGGILGPAPDLRRLNNNP